jgi:hypothetical protein
VILSLLIVHIVTEKRTTSSSYNKILDDANVDVKMFPANTKSDRPSSQYPEARRIAQLYHTGSSERAACHYSKFAAAAAAEHRAYVRWSFLVGSPLQFLRTKIAFNIIVDLDRQNMKIATMILHVAVSMAFVSVTPCVVD